MYRISVSVATAVCLVLAWIVPAWAEGTQTLVGEYVYYVGNIAPKHNVGELEAVFEPTGPMTWDVSFYFTFRETDMVYSGTAEGSLWDGTLTGTVVDDNEDRTYVFTGTVEQGRFKGMHAEVKSGKEHSTGRLVMNVPAGGVLAVR